MALVNRSFQLDITPGAIPRVVNVSEYDQNRQYTVTLVDDGGVFEIPSGTTAKVEGTIGGNAFSESATVSGNTITFTLSESMTAKAGGVWCKIKLTKDSKPIQTAAFILRCDKAGAEADTIINSAGFQGQIDEAVAKRFDTNLKILVLGNSFSQDAFAYLPPVLNELLPGHNITYGVAYTASCGAIKHMEMYNNDQNYDNFWLWRAGADHWSRYAGSGTAGYSLRKIMAAYDWDIVYMQSRGSIAADAMEQDMMDENITPGRELLRVLQDGINSHFVFLTGQWLSFVDQTTGDTLASYFRMRKAIKYVADRLGVDGVIPIGAGIAFARMDAALDALGENGHLLYDTHQQAGLPALISTYVIAQYLLKMMGRVKSVYTSSFVPSSENVTALNATAMTHGDPVGVTAENILKAQEIAVAAVEHPDSVYGETDPSEGGSGAVTSVNGKTGAVVLDAEDVGAYVKPASGIPASDLADDMPFFTLPESGEAGQALLSDGEGGAAWGYAPGGGGLTDDVKQAMLSIVQAIAIWSDDDAQGHYDELYAALYPPRNLVSISAAFNQGTTIIYNTDNLNRLKQYLTVTAIYGDSTTSVVTNYTLSGTLTVGTSVITVAYGGKTTTFNVVVTAAPPVNYINKINATQNAEITLGIAFNQAKAFSGYISFSGLANYSAIFASAGKSAQSYFAAASDKGSIVSLELGTWYRRNAGFGNVAINSSTDNQSRTPSGDGSDSTLYILNDCVLGNLVFADENGNTIADLRPCKDPNNVVCWHDEVSNQYVYNTGAGTLTEAA